MMLESQVNQANDNQPPESTERLYASNSVATSPFCGLEVDENTQHLEENSSMSSSEGSNIADMQTLHSSSAHEDFNLHLPSLSNSNLTAIDLGQSEASTTFEVPMRSRFSSPQPTSSLSADTAQASLSTGNAYTDTYSLSFLSNAGALRRNTTRSEVAAPVSMLSFPDYTISETEINGDDTQLGARMSEVTAPSRSIRTPMAAPFAHGPSHNSLRPERRHRARDLSNHHRTASDIPDMSTHLLHIGFKEGRHSDITVRAFQQQYRLHKLILERVPFFSSAFSGAWAESFAREMALDPEDIDTNISKAAFELALRRIYGAIKPQDEAKEAIGLFATGCWLDMPDLVETCVENMLRQMTTENLHTFINLVTRSYYGKAGDRILASAKAILCRDGWEMPYAYWDDIPSDIIQDVISGDPFYVPGEWERWSLATKLLNRRLKRVGVSEGLISSTGACLRPRPISLAHHAIRSKLDRTEETGTERQTKGGWWALYNHSEISPLLKLLDTGIHYIHLRFEQLQHLRGRRDVFGVPMLPEKVISDAFWRSMELRQLILNAHENDVELDLTEVLNDHVEAKEEAEFTTHQAIKGKQSEASADTQPKNMEDESERNDKDYPRRFLVPSTDVSCVIGGASETYPAAPLITAPETLHRSQSITAGFEPSDVAWPPDLGGSIFDNRGLVSRNVSRDAPRYSTFPPFRFCAEFPNPRTLKEKKRIYSQTVWYAGSLWNLYIQRVSTSKSQQLGIYLHRAKDKDPSKDPLAVTVDDRIGQLERELLLRKRSRKYRYWRTDPPMNPNDVDAEDDGTDSSGGNNSSNDPDRTLRNPRASRSNNGTTIGASGVLLTTTNNNSNLDATAAAAHRMFQRPTAPLILADVGKSPPSPGASASQRRAKARALSTTESISMSDDDTEEELAFLQSSLHANIPTIPPYVDARRTINTYFKIYSPSRGGRLLSVYESAPDGFEYGKSWGWLSRHLVLDDGIGDVSQLSGNNNKEGRLRYMVVLGNV